MSVVLSVSDGSVDELTGFQAPSFAAVLGDVDNDGKVDLVAAAAVLKVALGNGDGTLQAFTDGPTATGSRLVLADMNMDGHLDIVTNGTSGTGFSIALNQGNGTFATPMGYGASLNSEFVVGDVTGDGIPDVAAWGSALFPGDGSGGVGPEIATNVYGLPVAIADFNGDGHNDILIELADVSLGYALIVIPGQTGGTLGTPISTPLTAEDLLGSYGARVADINGDGLLDVIVAGTGFTVFLGYGDGYFGPALDYGFAAYDGIGAGMGPNFVISDHDGDGHPDIAFWDGVGIGIALQRACVPETP
jgi:hypothetical protein